MQKHTQTATLMKMISIVVNSVSGVYSDPCILVDDIKEYTFLQSQKDNRSL